MNAWNIKIFYKIIWYLKIGLLCQKQQLSWEYFLWTYLSKDQASFPKASKSRHFIWRPEHGLWEKGARTGGTLKLASIWGKQKNSASVVQAPWPWILFFKMTCTFYCFWTLLKGFLIRDTLPDHSIYISHPLCILLCTFCCFYLSS